MLFQFPFWGFPGGAVAKIHLSMQEMRETWAQVLSREDPLKKEMAAHSCLKNSITRGDWWATVHRVSESQTRLSTHRSTLFSNLGFLL